MKKILSLLLALTLVFSLFSMCGITASAAIGDKEFNETESNDSESEANLLYNDYTVYASVTQYDLDYYKFTVSSTSTVSLTFAASYSTIYCGIKNTSGDYIYSWQPSYNGSSYAFSKSVTLTEGTYYFVVMTSDYASYSKSYAFYYTCQSQSSSVVEDDTNFATPVVLSDGVWKTKAWTSVTDTKNCYNKFTLSSRGYITFTIEKPTDSSNNVFSLDLELSDTNGNKIWIADTTPQKNSFNEYYVYKIGLNAGTYIMNIIPNFYVTNGSIKALYKYDFTKSSYWEIENNNSKITATEIAVNKTYTAVYTDEYYTSQGYSDYFKVKLTKGTIYKYTIGNYAGLDGETFFLKGICDSNDKNVSLSNEKDNGTSMSWTFTAPNTGWYYLKFYNSNGGAGVEYTVNVSKYVVPVSELEVSLADTSYTYDGTTKTPEVEATYGGKYSGKKLVKDVDYTVTYPTIRKNVGTYKVTVKFKGNYSGTKTLSYKIEPKELWSYSASVTTPQYYYEYTGSNITPSVTVKYDSKVLKKDVDYTLVYPSSRSKLGTYKITVKYKGNYSGSDDTNFVITSKNASKAKVTLSSTSYTYDGKTKTPTVKVVLGSKTLKKGTDYTVSYPSSRKDVGTYKVTVNFKGNYSGSKSTSFKIKPVSVSKLKIKLSSTSYTYSGMSKRPNVKVTFGSKKLREYWDYSVTVPYEYKVGSYKVTIKMMGNYTGTKTLTFKINPAKTSVSKVTAGKKSLTVSINKKTEQVTGYQIQYSTSNKFTSAKTKTITSYKTTKTTIKGLKAKKNYYVRVRTYKTVNGKKYYSDWSKAKSRKTK